MARWLKRLALVVAVLALCAALGAWWLLRGSLAALDGELALPGLSAPVSVQRDARGVVTVDAANDLDAMRALGYVHAQERYFEMDLMRRTAAGELAELFGPIATDFDRRHRVHRLRARAERTLDRIAGPRMPQLLAYTDGVNAGLQALRARPWPYLLLRQAPQPWRPVDSALVGDAMYFDLQDDAGEREFALWQLRQHVPAALYALIDHNGSRWDAPLLGASHGDAALPATATLDLRTLPMPAKPRAFVSADTPFTGSNSFAVAGALTRDHRAILANDMHLGLRAPNLWFRARLRYPHPAAPDGRVDVQGVTLPGLPMVIVGSNDHVAWGFTNSYIDTTDWKAVTPCAGKATTTPCDRVATHRETIRIAGKPAVAFDVRDTEWGPILRDGENGHAYALRWTAQLPGAVNFGVADFADARDLDQALAVADRSAVPTQNVIVADAQGRIAWRLLGPIPQRAAPCDTRHLVEGAADAASAPDTAAADATAASPAATCAPWTIATDRAPLDREPAQSRLWTANNRIVDGADLDRVGDGGYDLAARARQIRDGLFAKPRFAERDLLAIQLDDRALLLREWWALLQRQSQQARTPAIAALAAAAAQAPVRADAGSVSYRLVRAWRQAVTARIADGLTAPAQAALGDRFEMPALAQLEGVAYPLASQQPPNLLPRRFACASRAHAGACDDAKDGWAALLEDAARDVRDGLSAQGPLAERSWGEHNTAHICHPLAGAIPLVGERLLCMPREPLAGDHDMPRVVQSNFGASERMVVSPGHEADGILHMPGGQSGHPLSPFWGAGHDDWVQGRPTPFLPGAATHTLTLRPR